MASGTLLELCSEFGPQTLIHKIGEKIEHAHGLLLRIKNRILHHNITNTLSKTLKLRTIHI